jgi:hypothetical protein
MLVGVVNEHPVGATLSILPAEVRKLGENIHVEEDSKSRSCCGEMMSMTWTVESSKRTYQPARKRLPLNRSSRRS